MTPKEIKDIICNQLDEHKAVDITVLDVEHLTVMTDYFVICTAKSSKQVRALAEMLCDKLEEQGIKAIRNDGMRDGKWTVLDFGSVIVHIFNDETRVFYCLEKLWSDGGNMQKFPE